MDTAFETPVQSKVVFYGLWALSFESPVPSKVMAYGHSSVECGGLWTLFESPFPSVVVAYGHCFRATVSVKHADLWTRSSSHLFLQKW